MPGLGGQTHQELVQLARGVDHGGVEERVGQRHHPCSHSSPCFVYQTEEQNGYITIIISVSTLHSLKRSLYESVAKSVCGRSEGVENGRVDLAVVVVGEAVAGGEDVQLCHEVRAEDDGQKLVVLNMLAGNSQDNAVG